MPVKPPPRVCVDCGRPIRPGWNAYGRCSKGKGCRAETPPPTSSAQTGEIPF